MVNRETLGEEAEEIRLINPILLGDILPQTVLAQAQARAKAGPTRPPPKVQQPIPFSGTQLQGRNERVTPKAKPEPVPKGRPKAIGLPVHDFTGIRGQPLRMLREIGPPPSPTPKRQRRRAENKPLPWKPPPKGSPSASDVADTGQATLA